MPDTTDLVTNLNRRQPLYLYTLYYYRLRRARRTRRQRPRSRRSYEIITAKIQEIIGDPASKPSKPYTYKTHRLLLDMTDPVAKAKIQENLTPYL